jgi:TonB family protein
MRTISLIGLVCCLVSGPLAANAHQAKESPVYEPGNGVSAPVVVREVKPQYTADAMRARVEGTATLEGVVQPDGSIAQVRVRKSLDPGLDQEAIKAIKQWRFTPGQKDGKAVAVRVTLEMSFTLRDKRPQSLFQVPPLAAGTADTRGSTEAPRVYKPGAGVSAPVAVKQVKPQYTTAAREAKVSGIVQLECVVETTGSVGDVKVTRSLDEGLDQEAIKAVKQWRFEPGAKDGKPVPVLITLEMTFTLR